MYDVPYHNKDLSIFSFLVTGGAGFIGAGVAYPVTSKVSLTADYAYQKGNNITQAYNGNILTGGVKYTF
jgi:outer membrane autotransporter protein